MNQAERHRVNANSFHALYGLSSVFGFLSGCLATYGIIVQQLDFAMFMLALGIVMAVIARYCHRLRLQCLRLADEAKGSTYHERERKE